MPEHVVAVDCDLRRSHAWSSATGKVGYNVADPFSLAAAIFAMHPEVILFECASPIEYRNKGQRNFKRWSQYNMYALGVFHSVFDGNLRCAPSHAWTRKLPEKVRQKLAQCTATNHDLRECECMLWSYQHQPGLWVPVLEYLEKL